MSIQPPDPPMSRAKRRYFDILAVEDAERARYGAAPVIPVHAEPLPVIALEASIAPPLDAPRQLPSEPPIANENRPAYEEPPDEGTSDGLLIRHFVGLNRTPALPLAVRAWHDLLQTGLCDQLVLLHWEQNAFVAFQHGTPIGLIVYDDAEALKQFTILLGYVLPDYRGNGVYGLLWHALVRHAQRCRRQRIMGVTSTANTAMRQHAEGCGRKEYAVQLDFLVPHSHREGTH